MKDRSPLITVVIPTRYAPPTLAATLHTFARQDIPIAMQIIDTGTAERDYRPWRNACQRLPNVSVSQIQPTRPEYPSHVITRAIDVGCDLAQTPYIILTHDDVWLNHRSVLTNLFSTMVKANTPLIGYEMSPRSHVTEEWRGMVSHTLTMIDRAWLQAEGLRWDMTTTLTNPNTDPTKPGWPDTETAFGRALNKRGIKPVFIGHETNDQHHVDSEITHRRSLTSHRLYHSQPITPDQAWIDSEVAKALKL